ncbi:YrhB domain-containing protein [Planotetraspora kaengkrachanensis]|uniref:Immunity protein 35 domain-containing protein n=1 Tax=Planotetraspora kaengkrachanensis TaxID=575193 RepID=A0A8J3PXQ7_9ACTN|nr:YrhB domain-containing protein [Planotetraspora kaengkrachanensis]GIG82806.1 hypothetical protein Pka01_59330 [Planotetraspora kaengkrachanensis]
MRPVRVAVNGEGEITEDRAVELVEALLSPMRQRSPWMPELAVLHVEEHALGWLVFWQSVEYVRGRDLEHMLAGHGPYLVDRQDGSIHHIPVTTYVSEDWEALYVQQIKDVRPPDPLATAVRELTRSEGAMAAMRHLRKHAPQLGPREAKAYVMAVRDGAEPPEELANLTRKQEAIPALSIDTVAGPTGGPIERGGS